MTLFDECILALGDNTEVLSTDETNEIFKELTKLFPMTSWGRINWEKVEKKVKITQTDSITRHLMMNDESYDKTVILLWDEATLPGVKTNLDEVIAVIDDVTAVSFDTWIFSPNSNYLIEFYHEKEVILGFCKLTQKLDEVKSQHLVETSRK